MNKAEQPILAIRSASAQEKTYSLASDFFVALEQDEITAGSLNVTLTSDERSGEVVRLRIALSGEVTTACDRCLEPVTFPVQLTAQLKLVDRELTEADGDDVRALQLDGSYDASWDIYELALLSLPLQRVHPEGACNPEMIARLAAMGAGAESEEAPEASLSDGAEA